MARNYTVNTRIAKPVAVVFAAIVSSDKLNKYFTNGSSSNLTRGTTVLWRWDDFGELPVVVRKVVEQERIELVIDSAAWKKTTNEAYDVSVIFEFEALEDGGTMLSISEEGWKTDADGLKGSHENCGGWTHMALCLKAWLEHDIDLR